MGRSDFGPNLMSEHTTVDDGTSLPNTLNQAITLGNERQRLPGGRIRRPSIRRSPAASSSRNVSQPSMARFRRRRQSAIRTMANTIAQLTGICGVAPAQMPIRTAKLGVMRRERKRKRHRHE